MSKKFEQGQIRKLSDRQHILQSPGMYIGSTERVLHKEYIYDFESQQLVAKQVDTCPALINSVREILYNAADNVGRSNKAGVAPKRIEMRIKGSKITIKNYGLGLDMSMHKKYNELACFIIFNSTKTGRNFKGKKEGAGRYGMGAKITATYSDEFTVDAVNAKQGKKFKCTWYDNKARYDTPEIEEIEADESYTSISFTLDFERFNYDKDYEYDDDVKGALVRYLFEISLAHKIPVAYNGTKYNFSDIKSFAALFTDAPNGIIHKQKYEDGYIEFAAFDTPNDSKLFALANSVCANQGGTHVKAVKTALFGELVRKLNEEDTKKGDAKKGPLARISFANKHVSLVINYWSENCDFQGQFKEKLTKPSNIPIDLKPAALKTVESWESYKTIRSLAMYNRSIKSRGKKLRYVLERGKHANWVFDQKKRHRCDLIGSEGDSAMGYVETWLSYQKHGRDQYGTFIYRGKILNAMNASDAAIAHNQEIQELICMIGLEPGVDYTQKENLAKLNYRKFILFGDADTDGSHCKGLIIATLYSLFPTLIQSGFICELLTPVLRLHHRKKHYNFYTIGEYTKFIEENPELKDVKPEYCKGLGTSSDAQVKSDEKQKKILRFIFDKKADKNIKKAFDKKFADERKDWIAEWVETYDIIDVDTVDISHFINNDVVRFAVDNLKRSIAAVTDTLTIARRKIIYTALKYWNYRPHVNKIKVAQLAGMVAQKTHYLHNEMILGTVITNMTQTFTGSNNEGFFTADGQFGTRNKGGKDAASTRYTYCRLERWVTKCFRKEDEPILELAHEEGHIIEPKRLLPIIPILGVEGIGTGSSCFIPNYSKFDEIKQLRRLIRGKSVKIIEPSYRDYSGEITVVEKKPDEEPEVSESESESNSEKEEKDVGHVASNTGNVKLQMVTSGLLEIVKADTRTVTIKITELPLRKWNNTYIEFLNKLWAGTKDKKDEESKEIGLITKAPINQSVKNRVNFTVTLSTLKLIKYGFLSEGADLDNEDVIETLITKLKRYFRLTKAYGLTNYVLLDEDNRPVKFETIGELLESFYKIRLGYYVKRKEYHVAEYKTKIKAAKQLIKYIRLVNNETIRIHKTSEEKLLASLAEHGLPADFIDVPIKNLTEQGEQRARDQLDKIKAQLEEYDAVSPEQMWLNELDELEEELNKYDPHPKKEKGDPEN